MKGQEDGGSAGWPRFRLSLLGVLACIGFLFSSVPGVDATQPPRPGEIEELKAKGKFKERLKFAKELGNDKVSPGLVRKFKGKKKEIKRKYLESQGIVMEEDDSSDYAGESPSSAGSSTSGYVPPADENKGLPTTGNPKIFALLISFADYPHTVDQNIIDDMLWGDGSLNENVNHYPRESLVNYYLRSSYGLLDLSGGHTFGWYQTAYNRSEVLEGYADNQGYLAREALIKEALQYFDSLGHDFSQYDHDGDGKIDYFVVFWTGPNTGWATFWWAYKTSWSSNSFSLDGKTLGAYSWQWESDLPTVVIHETGHALGLPDYYDYDDDVGPRGGVGGFDMMDANKGDHNCFSKWLLGWLTPTAVSSGSQNLTLRDTTTKDCVLVWPGIGLTDMFNEFFLVQNRQDTENDESFSFAPDGLVIWHVDATLKHDGSYFAYNNSYTEHKLIRLMEADGLEEIENGFSADRDDLYKEDDELSPESSPSSAKYSGYESCVRIWNIMDNGTERGSTITATFNFACECATTPDPTELIWPVVGATNVSTTPTLHWISVSGATSYHVQVCEDIDCSVIVHSTTSTPNYWVVSTPLSDWKDYWWRVRVNGSCDASVWTPARTFTTLCEADPVDMPVHRNPVDGALNTAFDPALVWNAVADASHYQVAVCSDPNCNSVIREADVFHNTAIYLYPSWDVTPDLESNTQYWWKVRAANRCLYGDWSSPWSFTTHPVFPAPALISPIHVAIHQPLSPTFQWQAVDGANSYSIQISKNAEFVQATSNYIISETQMPLFAPLDQGTTHYWRVKCLATGGTGDGPWSVTRSFTTCIAVDPPTPASLLPESGATGVSPSPTLRWDLPPGNEFPFYDVEVCTDSACTDVVRTKHLSATQWTITPGLDLNTTYYWRIRSSSACGESAWVSASFTTSECPVPTLTPSTVYPGFGETDVSVTPTLEWTYMLYPVFSPGTIEICSDYDCRTIVRTATTEMGTSSWTVTPPLEPATQYWWRVSYMNSCGPGPWSPTTNFRTVFCIVPNAPTATDPGASVAPWDEYTVTWTASSGAGYYTIQESTTNSFTRDTTESFTVTKTSKTFSHGNSSCSDVIYYYRVKAHSNCGSSAWSKAVNMLVEETSVPTRPALNSPADRAIGQPIGPVLQWTSVRDAADYDVQVCSDDRCATVIRSRTLKETAWTVTPWLEANTPYWWRVRARGCGESAWSTLWKFGTACAPPFITDVAGTVPIGETYTVSWTAVPNAVSYILEEDEHPEFLRPTVRFEGNKTSWTLTAENPGCVPRTLYYRVKAEGSSELGGWSKTMAVEIAAKKFPAAPGLITPADKATNVSITPTLDWTDTAGADDYDVWICIDSRCSTVFPYATVKQSQWAVSPALRGDTDFWWQVRAKNNCGATLSPQRTFRTCALPGTPTLDNPGISVASGEPYTVTWKAIDGVTFYILQEAKELTFNRPTEYIVDKGTSKLLSHENKGCEPDTYYYRVFAANSCGPGEPSKTVDIMVRFPDTDKDKICDYEDNCPEVYNPDQQDADRNGIGDACQYSINARAATPGGSVSGAGVYLYNEVVTLTAEPARGYRFLYWTEDGRILSNRSTITFLAIEDRALLAHFERIEGTFYQIPGKRGGGAVIYLE